MRSLFLFRAAVCLAGVGLPLGLKAATEPPRLAVVISIDQFRGDYLARFRPHFVAGGFRRLMEGGAWFENCHYRHAGAMTAVGHATILSGVHSEDHGIIANEWLRRDSLEQVGAVQDPVSPIVGAAPRQGASPGGVFDAKSGRSPRNFEATTVGDQLKLRHGDRSRVVSVANKDRAAILLGGRFADAAYWVDAGRFVTSRYYRDALPEWAEAFNAEGRVEKDFGRVWDHLLEPKIYDALQGPDAAAGEEIRLGLGGTFPRTIDGGQPTLSSTYLEAYSLTPFYTELLGAFAKAVVRAEQLGRHPAPDLLCIGFSQIDHVGHSFGPDSHEVMDAVLRLDRVLADFFAFLDAEIGPERYTVVITADHGVSPLPERVQAFNRDVAAGRLDVKALEKGCDDALTTAFGAPPENSYWVVRDAYGVRLRPATLRARNVTPEAAQAVVKQALLANPQIALAFTRDELLATRAEGEGVLAMVRRSYYGPRSQDVMFVPKPYVVDRAPAGTNHGTPYDYDTHVPLLWGGASVPRGEHIERVGVDDLAPTLTALLGVPPPPQARGRRLF